MQPVADVATPAAVDAQTARLGDKLDQVLEQLQATLKPDVLKAERDCVVEKLLAAPGESLAVDQAIIGFK